MKKTSGGCLYVAFLAALWLAVCSPAGVADARNFSGLEGKALTPSNELEAGLESLLRTALSHDKDLKGEIEKVLVVDDSERELVLRVNLSGFEGRKIWGELQGADKKKQDQFLTEPASIDAGTKQVELKFKLSKNLPEGTQLESTHLRLCIARPDRSAPSRVYAYLLGKKWQIEVLPENVVVKVTPVPIGEAAKLPKQKTAILPPPKTYRLKVPAAALIKPAVLPVKPAVKIQPVTPTSFSIRLLSDKGYYLVADNGGGGLLRANTKKAGPWTAFTLVDLNGGKLASGDKIQLKTSDGKHYVVAEGGGGQSVLANRSIPREWETFVILRVGGTGEIKFGDRVALRVHDGQYVSAAGGGGGNVSAGSRQLGSSARFNLQAVIRPMIVTGTVAPVKVTPMLATQLDKQAKPAAPPRISPVIADRLVLSDKFVYGLNKEIKDKKGKGPAAQAIHLLTEIASDVELDLEEILKVWPQVFQDQNPGSGVFYFLPRAFHLKWTPEEGYGMRMLYYASAEEGKSGEVGIEMFLNAGIGSKEYNFAKDLLNAYALRHPEAKFTELRPLPIDKAPEVSLSGGLQHTFNIPSDKITINAISDALGELHVSLTTDWVTKENLQLALLEDIGLNGTLSFSPSGGALPGQERPIHISLADHRTLGRIYWNRTQSWRNEADYPVYLKHLHVLYLKDKKTPYIYSWSLDNTEVQPLTQVLWDARNVPSWLDNAQEVKFMWVSYGVKKDCKPCDDKVIRAITGGVDRVSAQKLLFETITPLADTGAYKIFVTVRSRYLHPTSRELGNLPEVVLDADEKEYVAGTLYLVDRQAGESIQGDPLFEYLMTVVMRDGQTHRATKWIPNDGLRVMIGQTQIKQALGFLPGGGN